MGTRRQAVRGVRPGPGPARRFRLLLAACLCAPCLVAQEADPTAELRVTTTPDAAIVSCDRVVRDHSPLTVDGLSAGEHLLTARKDGFREARRTLTLSASQRMAVELRLEPLLGLVLVHADPEGAEVEINGASRGRAPVLITDLPLGAYRVRFSCPGFGPKEVDLHVRDRTPRMVQVQLTSDAAKLSVDSTPPGATVSLNGIVEGQTPCKLERVPTGEIRLELTMQGFEPHASLLKLTPGQDETVSATLQSIPAELRIVTIPAGVRIYVGDQFRGTSPVTLPGLAPGTYDIRAEHPGYEPVTASTVLDRADRHTQELRLVKNSGQFEVTTQPAGVRVFIGGKDSGLTRGLDGETQQISEPLRIEGLPPGTHKVVLTMGRYHDESFTIEVERDKTTTKHLKLRRRFMPDYEVRTDTEIYQGVLLGIDPQGDVKLEIMPGILRTVPAKDVRSRGPLRGRQGQ